MKTGIDERKYWLNEYAERAHTALIAGDNFLEIFQISKIIKPSWYVYPHLAMLSRMRHMDEARTDSVIPDWAWCRVCWTDSRLNTHSCPVTLILRDMPWTGDVESEHWAELEADALEEEEQDFWKNVRRGGYSE